MSHWAQLKRKARSRQDLRSENPDKTLNKHDFSWNQTRIRQNRPGAEIHTHRNRNITDEMFIIFFLDSSETEMFLLRKRPHYLTCISSRVSEEISTESQTETPNIYKIRDLNINAINSKRKWSLKLSNCPVSFILS